VSRLQAVVKVLKARFNNLGALELIELAEKILVAIDQVEEANRC